MGLSASCLVCRLKDEFIEHAFLHCSRDRLIWRMVGSQPWEASIDSWLGPFLDAVC